MYFKHIIFFLVALICAFVGCNTKEIGKALSINEDDFDFDNGIKEEKTLGVLGSNLCLAEHNAARNQNGKGALIYNDQLEQAAINHNKVMVSQNCFSHQCSGEASMGNRVTSTGYRWSGAAENIAAGSTNCKDVMNQWMNSSGHKANILGNYKNVGCARTECSSCSYKVYWTCVFGSPM